MEFKMKQFPKNSRVCFVGDSITHRSIFSKHIVAYYREHFSELSIEFYNCGIAGGYLSNTIRIFDEDVAIYDPTHIVLMIGVNDSRRDLLSRPSTEERYEKLHEAYEKYKNNMECFYQLTSERGIELILCTPAPYAEYQKTDEFPPLPGGYALIGGYADFVRSFAREHGLALCDYHKAMTRAMQTEILFDPDRVHPTQNGHAVMAKEFLSMLGIDYEPLKTFSDDIEEWYDVTQTLRNIITTEFLMIPGYANMNDDERSAKISEYYENMKNGSYAPGPYFERLVLAYVKNKPSRSEYVDFVKKFMKR